jgi:1-phosphatidylinositol-3-phosphate 5-kinase
MRGTWRICEFFFHIYFLFCDLRDCSQALTELAPSYFRYMDATTSKPTVLAKLMGFYTIETKNLESGIVQATDLLVMENLFYGQNISKKFDLKGIQGRKVKTRGDAAQTLFDGEWIEGVGFFGCGPSERLTV